MLVIVREDQPKIAMGMLSYLPGLQSVAAVRREISWYQASDDRELLLWQNTDNQHYTACLGVETVFNSVMVRHIVFSPEIEESESYAIGAQILQELTLRCSPKSIIGTLTTQAILTKWRETQDEQ